MHDVSTSLVPTSSGLVIFRSQEIPDDFLDALRSERLASASIREGEHHHVASVPAEVFDLWHAQGLDPFNMTGREIVRRLRHDNLEVFITTAKRV